MNEAQVYKEGYNQALDDMLEKLDNALSNGGGVHFGEHFVERVHWDHELRDLINDLKSDYYITS